MISTAPPTASDASKPRDRRISLGLTLSASEGVLLTDLATTPHTIGTGPRCSVRVEGPGLRPMHCVVTPTEEGPVVRRWATETLLNGADFTESVLAAGDRLHLGSSVELEVIELPSDGSQNLESNVEAAPETDLVSDQSEAPTPAASPEAEADDITTNPAEQWLGSGIDSITESLQSITSDEPAVASDVLDPAIPSHLLQPGSTDWADDTSDPFAEATQPSSPAIEPQPAPEATAGGAELDWTVPSVTDEQPEAVTFESSTLTTADAWAAEFSDASPATEEPADELLAAPASEAQPADHPAIDALPPFEAESLVQETPNAPTEGFELLAEPAEMVEVAAPEAAPAESPEVNGAAFAEATRHMARLRERLASNRRRVAALVAALRQRREEIASLEASVAERDEMIGELQGHLQDALEVGEAARAELVEWQQAAQAAPETEQIEPATEPELADTVEDQFAQAEARLAAAQAEAEAEQIAADLAATAPTDPGVESTEAFYQTTPAEPAFAEQPTEDEPAGESLWGIEQLAEPSQEAEPLQEATQPESLWDQAPAIEPAGEPTKDALEPVQTPLEEAPSDSPTGLEVDYDEPTATEPIADEVASVELADEQASVGEGVPGEEASTEENRVEIGELIAQAAAKTAFDPLVKEETEEAKPHEAPASFIEQYADTLPPDDEPVESPAPVEPITEAAEATDSGGEDDDSIDDYMQKLMARVRGEAAPAAPAASPQPTPAAPTPSTDSHAATTSEPTPEPAAPAPIKCLSELKREPVRQSTTDMGALRQLANQSARHAIDVAATRDNREQATLRLTGSAVVLGCGALATIMAPDLLGTQFFGGIAGMLAGGWFGVKTLKGCQKARLQEEVAAVSDSAG